MPTRQSPVLKILVHTVRGPISVTARTHIINTYTHPTHTTHQNVPSPVARRARPAAVAASTKFLVFLGARTGLFDTYL